MNRLQRLKSTQTLSWFSAKWFSANELQWKYVGSSKFTWVIYHNNKSYASEISEICKGLQAFCFKFWPGEAATNSHRVYLHGFHVVVHQLSVVYTCCTSQSLRIGRLSYQATDEIDIKQIKRNAVVSGTNMSLVNGGPATHFNSCDGILDACKYSGKSVEVKTGQKVHTDCRRYFIRGSKRQKHKADVTAPDERQQSLRSAEDFFLRKEHCSFCGTGDRYDWKRTEFALMSVRTLGMKDSILKVYETRGNSSVEKMKSV